MKVTNLTVDCLTHKTKLDQEAVETQAAQVDFKLIDLYK